MPQVSSNTVGSIRQNEQGRFELLAPGGENIFSADTEAEARNFADRDVNMPVREGVTPFTLPTPLPTVPPGASGALPGASGGQTGAGVPSSTFGAPQGVSPLTAGRAQLPGPNEFTNLLKKVVDVKLGRRPFIIGIPDEDLALLTPSSVRGELGRRANKLLEQGADVFAIMQSYQGMYKDTLDVADKYLRDMEKRQDLLREFSFSEAVLTNGVLPEQLKKILSGEEQAIWGEMSKFYKAKRAKGELPELIAKDIDSATGETQLIFRDSITGAITRQTMAATRSPDRQIVLDMIKEYDDAGIMPTDTLQQAQAKLSKSRIYQDKVRAPSGTTPPSGKFTFGTSARDKLIGADYSLSDIQNVEARIQAGESVEDIIKEFNIVDNQANVLRQVFSGDKSETEMTEEEAKQWLQRATVTEDGENFLDFSKIPVSVFPQVMAAVEKFNLLPDETVAEESKGFFAKLKEQVKTGFGLFSP